MYRCEDCGELFHECYTEKWDVGSHFTDVDLCPYCHSEFITELSWEQAEIYARREDRKNKELYYRLYPHRKPFNFEEQLAKDEAEDYEYEKELKKEGKWK